MDTKIVFPILLLLVIAFFTFIGYKAQSIKRVFHAEVKRLLEHTAGDENDLLTEEDIKHLPEPVQKYIRYANVLGKEKVRNLKVVFGGEFRVDKVKPWAKMNAIQYTNLVDTTRLYYMEMKMFGLPVLGLHKYSHGIATMQAKVAGLIAVVNGKGPEMNEGETVTVFNDMCMLAPGSLIDNRIQWQPIDSHTVNATFTNCDIIISGTLYFNEIGELINFTSEDRYYSPTGKTFEKVKWSTPISGCKDYSGIRIPSGGEAVWSFPEGDYSYGRINIKEIKYNVK